jgi:transcriptional regulator with PAS, ATPase and Fis domain
MANEPLTRKEIEVLLEQKGDTLKAVIYTIEQDIKKHKLPFKIIDGICVDVGESTDAWLSRFVTENPKMLQLKEDVRKLATVEDDSTQLFSVLISGPTGTGKELIALALHGDRVGEFVPINCAGLPSELVESELFGHVQGSFTGATRTKDGLMKIANNGTLFLDEIGELSLQVQAKLLRAIQEKKIRKVGGDKDEIISCRIVCATHRDLKDMCKHNKFRIDLYARISTFELDTIKLLERQEDIVPIINSIPGGKEFYEALTIDGDIINIDLSLNVRSLQQHIKRYKVLGKLPLK